MNIILFKLPKDACNTMKTLASKWQCDARNRKCRQGNGHEL